MFFRDAGARLPRPRRCPGRRFSRHGPPCRLPRHPRRCQAFRNRPAPHRTVRASHIVRDERAWSEVAFGVADTRFDGLVSEGECEGHSRRSDPSSRLGRRKNSLVGIGRRSDGQRACALEGRAADKHTDGSEVAKGHEGTGDDAASVHCGAAGCGRCQKWTTTGAMSGEQKWSSASLEGVVITCTAVFCSFQK